MIPWREPQRSSTRPNGTSYGRDKTARPVHPRIARAATTESELTGLPLVDVLEERRRVAALAYRADVAAALDARDAMGAP